MERLHGVISAYKVLGFSEVLEYPAISMMHKALNNRHRYAVYFVADMLHEEVERINFLLSNNWHFKAICAIKARAVEVSVADRDKEYWERIPNPDLPDYLPPQSEVYEW